jgi:hypothetical protein
MAGREFPNQASYSRELISRNSMRNDEHSTMGTPVIEEPNREPDEIIPVSGHQASLLRGSKVELPLIRCLAHPYLMSTEGINSTSPKYLSNLRTEVLIQIKLHDGDLVKG